MKTIALCLILFLFPATGFAQSPTDSLFNAPPPQAEKMRSKKLAVIGGVTAAVGFIGLLGTIETEPEWGETYHLYGDQYCVQSSYAANYFDVKDGSCSDGSAPFSPKIIPYMTVAGFAGTAMLIIGTQKVKVKPMLSPKVAGAQATVSWGGAR